MLEAELEKVNLYLFLPTWAMLMSNARDVWACVRMQTHNILSEMTPNERKIKGLPVCFHPPMQPAMTIFLA